MLHTALSSINYDSDRRSRYPPALGLLTVCTLQKRLLGVCPHTSSRGTQAFRPPAAPYGCAQRHPFMPVYKAAHSPGPLDPAAAGRSPSLSIGASCWPSGPGPTYCRTLSARFFSHAWHALLTSDWPGAPAVLFDWATLSPRGEVGAGRSKC